jgi:hypothetical protein
MTDRGYSKEQLASFWDTFKSYRKRFDARRAPHYCIQLMEDVKPRAEVTAVSIGQAYLRTPAPGVKFVSAHRLF